MQTTLAALKALHEKLGGPAKVWLGHSMRHGWLLLDRTLKPHLPGSHTAWMTFERLEDWSQTRLARRDWAELNDLKYYTSLDIQPTDTAPLVERLNAWHQGSDERARKQGAIDRQEHAVRLFAQQSLDNSYQLSRIRQTSSSQRSRADMLTLLRHELRGQQVAERAAIEGFVYERRIQFLVHFTAASNLPSILADGLLPRETLASRAKAFHSNDELRKEGLMEATSVSISFPNYSMLFKQRIRPGSGAFCILALDPAILWELPCLFCPRNASSRSFFPDSALLENEIGVTALSSMFHRGDVLRETYGLSPSYTTDPQAEALVLDAIATRYIKGLVLPPGCKDTSQREVLVQMAAHAGVPDMTPTHRAWFGKRADAAYWTQVKRFGA